MDCMKTIQATPYITQLTWLGLFNAFLVREADGFTLVDTMISGAAERIIRCAQGLQMPIVRIAITHAHADHVGSLATLASRLPDANRFISRREARFLAGDWSLDKNEPHTKLRVKFPLIPIPMERFDEGDRIGSLRVIATPGHTPGHACFMDIRYNILLAGDVYATINGVATSARIYPGFPPPGMFTWNRALAQHSAQKLLALQPSLLLTGHGSPVLSPIQKMTAAVQRSER